MTVPDTSAVCLLQEVAVGDFGRRAEHQLVRLVDALGVRIQRLHFRLHQVENAI